MLEEAEIRIVKIWLDISKAEQARRLDARRNDPLKALKVSDLDGIAQEKWKDYSKARNEMLIATHTAVAPWICVHADDKKPARLSIIAPPAAHPGARACDGQDRAAGPADPVPVRGAGADRRAAGEVASPCPASPPTGSGEGRLGTGDRRWTMSASETPA